MTLPEARRVFADLMQQARTGKLTEHARARLAQARQMLRRAKRLAMNPRPPFKKKPFQGGFIVRSYYGRVVAGKGLLLGGVRVHESSRFKTFKAANSWLATVVDGNIDAGRDVETADVIQSSKPPEIDNPGKLTSSKARLILHEGTVRGHKLTPRQRGFFGARASGSPRRNPAGFMQRIGRAVEVRYQRDIGRKPGYYKHEIRSRKAGVYTIPPGWVYVGSKSILITEREPRV